MEIVVIGAGIVGLAAAWRTAQRGGPDVTVTLVDPEPASGATSVAAGMITPVGELAYGEEALLRLNLASRDRYDAFIAEVEELTGARTGYRDDGLLQVAFDADDLAVLDDLRRFQASLGLPVEALTGRECRKLEPMLAPGVRGGLLAPRDGSVDPRRLAAALLTACEKSGVRPVRSAAKGVVVERDAVAGVRLADGTVLRADRVLLAAGPWSGDLEGLPDGTVPSVRPVKGQVIRLRTRVPFLRRCTRGLVKGSPVYLVPRADDGEIVLGATQEELGFDTRVTAGGLWELLRDARELFPGVTELEFAEVRAGLRPGSPDNAPVMGAAALPGLVLGTGHFRHGVLLAPVSADALSAMLLDGPVPEVARPFSPERFSPERIPEVNR
ncbi:glycine oxidase ThiO [Actinomadura algeriensis]|uniref:glycine oxidase n=1 Tax=Actinomadura algeriensis TaxID=1679523 RepID=A0ABR9JYK5_9ACTN|nr:glycine oxidase ThiO [Actinomadura algeriensis]MBE1535185.1 glycine oxidase [Actinomadura algeriensis]